jgi:hypothetical protein
MNLQLKPLCLLLMPSLCDHFFYTFIGGLFLVESDFLLEFEGLLLKLLYKQEFVGFVLLLDDTLVLL